MIDNGEDIDMVNVMYNLLEFSENETVTSESLWSYHRSKIDTFNDNNSQGKSFEYKTKVIGKTPARSPQQGNPGDTEQPVQLPVPYLNVQVTTPLKYFSNFWRSVHLPFIYCKIKLHLSWTKYFVLIEHCNNITGVNFF